LGITNIVQATDGDQFGNYSSDSFSNISPMIIVPGLSTITNFTDVSVPPNTRARYYRIKMVSTLTTQVFDNAAQSAYTNGWSNNSNGGSGLGSWTLTETSPSINSNGFIVSSSTNNGAGNHVGIDTDGQSWGLYANGGNSAVAYRAFSRSVPIGAIFSIAMDNGYVSSNSPVGFALRNGDSSSSVNSETNGMRFLFEYVGSSSSNSYQVVDNNGRYPIGVPFTDTGLNLLFTLTSADTYTLLVINNASGATNATVNGTLAGIAGGALNSIALFNNSAGAGSAYNLFFNSLQILSP
jgi:hypothetical protein